MKEFPITAIKRESVGKGFARRERMAGRIPAVVYGPEFEPMAVAIDAKELRTTMKSSSGVSSIFNMTVDGKETKVVMRDLQRDPVSVEITHIDFHAVSMTKPISIAIPIHLIGVPRGVKVDGGIMQTTMREIEISCLLKDIPEVLEINVEDLGIGDSIHVRDVDVPNVKITSPEQRTIVVIAAPTVIKETVTEGEEAEGEEGEAAAEGAVGAEGAAEAAEGDENKDKKDK